MSKVTTGLWEYYLKIKYWYNPEDDYEVPDEEIKVVYDEDFEGWDPVARRPYFRLRGPKVTEEQAFEILRRTDYSLCCMRYKSNDKYIELDDWIGALDFCNMVFVENVYPGNMGWCKPDGTIGYNSKMDKNPVFHELLEQFYRLIKEFPYIDFVMAITWWDEIPSYVWEAEDREEFIREEFDDFKDNLEIVFYVHDKTVEILGGAEAVTKYKEYEDKYEKTKEDSWKYCGAYYRETGTKPAGIEYFDKMLETYNLKRDDLIFCYEPVGKQK